MSMSDINKMNEKQRKMSVVDKELLELETMEYQLERNPTVYGENLEFVKKHYMELKEYYK